ncbi:HD-GYP domain-containing protein [Litchfieldia alkalitelluris]|uniref:HD-GYP domain-containing protein n=1 Tax=Litchfieldia alkalitelluris TaxID=304268 RepID=UPI001F1B9D75|nr:HD-GYP domain-containing protein [Litchfieldia alkalitelluris]
MKQPDENVVHVQKGAYLKQSEMTGSVLSLLLQKKNLEIIHHYLPDNQPWVLGPSDGWKGLEFVYILKGGLTWHDGITMRRALAGDHLVMDPITRDVYFKSSGETEFLYLSSEKMFDEYTDQVTTFMDLAVSVEEKDGYTADHCKRIMKLSIQVGEKLGLSSQDLYHLNIGSFLHDIGKTKIPDHILNKPGKLTPDEYDLMKRHTTYGGAFLRETGIPELVEASWIVEHHHERYNGSGYPHGLQGDDISLSAHIVGVVDSFDAMTSVRVYSQGRSVAEAIAEIKRHRGTLFHPDVVDAFLSFHVHSHH